MGVAGAVSARPERSLSSADVLAGTPTTFRCSRPRRIDAPCDRSRNAKLRNEPKSKKTGKAGQTSDSSRNPTGRDTSYFRSLARHGGGWPIPLWGEVAKILPPLPGLGVALWPVSQDWRPGLLSCVPPGRKRQSSVLSPPCSLPHGRGSWELRLVGIAACEGRSTRGWARNQSKTRGRLSPIILLLWA